MYGGQQGKEERIEKFLRGPSGKQGKVERTEKFLKSREHFFKKFSLVGVWGRRPKVFP